MPVVTYKFNLPEDRTLFDAMIKGPDLLVAGLDFAAWIGSLENFECGDEAGRMLDKCIDAFYDIFGTLIADSNSG